jgi:tetratricopeptide (TPR) repeat protein
MRWYVLGVVCAGLAAYWNGLSGPFIFDDQGSIVDNPTIRQLSNPGAVLSPARALPVAGRPLVNLSFALNYAIGGLGVRGYHVANLAIHLACALLVFSIVWRTLRVPALRAAYGQVSTPIAFAASVIWVVHPLNTEAVDYLTQRSELLMALFYLSTLYAAIRAWSSPHARAWEAASWAACTCGMACKESMVTAPLMIVAYDAIFLFGSLRRALRERWRLYAGLAGSWALLAALLRQTDRLDWWSNPRLQSVDFSTPVSAWTYLLDQTVMLTRYLHLVVWPRSLVANYGWPAPVSLATVAPEAVLVAVLLLLTIVAFVRRPMLGFLGAWFFMTLAPTSSFVPMVTEVGAERRMYLPLVALVVVGVIAASRAIALLTRRAPHGINGINERVSVSATALSATALSACALGIIVALLAAGTVVRNREYSSSVRLARTIVDRYPTPVGHHVLGAELSLAGDHQAAERELRLALSGAPRAHFSLGVELLNQGRANEAIDELRSFVRDQPELLQVVAARELLGRTFDRQRRWSEAVEQYRTLAAMIPTNPEYQGHLAESLFEQQAFEEAIGGYQTYLAARPDDVVAFTNLGIALAETHRMDQAVEAFRHAVALDPQNGKLQKNLARALVDRDRTDEAVGHARRAVALRPDDPGVHDILGRVLALQGHIAEARAEFERALALDPADGEAHEDLSSLLRQGPGRRPIK